VTNSFSNRASVFFDDFFLLFSLHALPPPSVLISRVVIFLHSYPPPLKDGCRFQGALSGLSTHSEIHSCLTAAEDCLKTLLLRYRYVEEVLPSPKKCSIFRFVFSRFCRACFVFPETQVRLRFFLLFFFRNVGDSFHFVPSGGQIYFSFPPLLIMLFSPDFLVSQLGPFGRLSWTFLLTVFSRRI